MDPINNIKKNLYIHFLIIGVAPGNNRPTLTPGKYYYNSP